jgi:hypothetical protein
MHEYSDEQRAAWEREAATVPVERVLEVVTHRMWRHEAENGCALRFSISIQVAIYFVSRAKEAGLIEEGPGKVWPGKETKS